MGKLLSMLEAEGRKRSLIRSGQTVDAKAAFALLKDMPYQRASTREPEAIIQEGRHLLWKALFLVSNLLGRMVGVTGDNVHPPVHRGNHSRFPARIGRSRGSVPDVNIYIRLNTEAGWMMVDATWPTKVASLGMTVKTVSSRETA